MKIDQVKKANNLLIFGFLIIAAMYIGASFLIPIAFAILLATLLLPVANLLERKYNISRITSAFLSTVLVFVVVSLLFFLLIHQLKFLLNDLIERRGEIKTFIQGIQENLASASGISLSLQKQLIEGSLVEGVNLFQTYLTDFLSHIFEFILKFLLITIYLFLFLLNRNKFLAFLMMYVPEEKKEETKGIVQETEKVANYYLWGRIQVMTILATMYIITFLAYDLEHSALLVVFGTIITIIPYLGPFVSGLIPILFMIIFQHSLLDVISFTFIIIIVQLIESYILEPVLMGSELEQSPLFVVIAVLLGGMIWGIAGLILFVPLFAILKIIFDHSRGLKPVGFLMGYKRPEEGEGIIEKIKRKLKK